MINGGEWLISGSNDKILFSKVDKLFDKGLGFTLGKKIDYKGLLGMDIANLEFKCLILTNGDLLEVIRIDKFEKILSVGLNMKISTIRTLDTFILV